MYWLLSIDAIARIVVAMAILFALVPALAARRPDGVSRLEWFFWNLGVGIAMLTLIGQILSLANLFSLLTLAGAAILLIVITRARQSGVSPMFLVRRTTENAFLALLNIFDRRVHLGRRIRRAIRRARARLRASASDDAQSLPVLGWVLLTLVAAGLRLYRPFASANLGYSDTYVHLYLLKLLGDGRQVDPDFGPYPRGLHFLLLSIQKLTNVDAILLMNFFGAVAGVIMTLAVADTARRLTRSVPAGLVAGFLFATLVGGSTQYFVLGGGFSGGDQTAALSRQALPYEELAKDRAEFDLALIDFQRQTSTLSQELAIALLLPAALFLLTFLRTRSRWHLVGYGGSTAAIAAVHSGVVVPLVFMSAIALAAAAVEKRLRWSASATAFLAGAAGVVVGSAWALAFVAYPYAGGKSHTSLETSVASAALYYFPFLRRLAGDVEPAIASARVYTSPTFFTLACAVVAVLIAAVAFRRRDEMAGSRVWIALVFLTFLAIHLAAYLGMPQVLEPSRNSQWLLMALCALLGVALFDAAGWLERWGHVAGSRALAAVMLLPLLAWTATVPRLSAPAIHGRIVNYSGYGGSALAALRISRELEPYTWTLVSYGQEFPMVLRRGFHVPAVSFLEQYDPASNVLAIPTPHVFVIVEKTPHPFQINTWAAENSRGDLEERLQTWVHVYQATHRNVRVYLEDENVRVYQIERTPAELELLARQGGRR
jgi:hypothetical protein